MLLSSIVLGLVVAAPVSVDKLPLVEPLLGGLVTPVDGTVLVDDDGLVVVAELPAGGVVVDELLPLVVPVALLSVGPLLIGVVADGFVGVVVVAPVADGSVVVVCCA